jgi:hypothetical protein
MTAIELVRLLQSIREHIRPPSHSTTLPSATSGWWEVLEDGKRHDRRTNLFSALEEWLDEKTRDVAQALTCVPIARLPERLQRAFAMLRVERYAASASSGPDLNFRIDVQGGGKQVRGPGGMYDDEDDEDDLNIVATKGGRAQGRKGEAGWGSLAGPDDGTDGEGRVARRRNDDLDEFDDGGPGMGSRRGGGLSSLPFGIAGLGQGGMSAGGGMAGVLSLSELGGGAGVGDGVGPQAPPRMGGGAAVAAGGMDGPGSLGTGAGLGGPSIPQGRDRLDGPLQVQKKGQQGDTEDDGAPKGPVTMTTIDVNMTAEDRKRLMSGTSKAKMLDDFIKKIKGQAADSAVSMRPDVEWQRIGLRPDVKLAKTSYALLTRLPAFLRIRNELLADLRGRLMRLPPSGKRRVFEFCILVDNSGSMDGEIGKQVRISLTLLMETLRRLEMDFSVIRFGKAQKRLKQLDEAVDSLRGQVIIESLTFDEGTQLRSAVKAAMQLGFQRRKPLPAGSIVSRSVIIMSDGFVETAGDEGQRYSEILAEGAAALGGMVRMCFCGLLEKFAVSRRAEILEGMNFLTGGTQGKAESNKSITLIEPGKAREMVPKLCSLVGEQFRLMLDDSIAVEKALREKAAAEAALASSSVSRSDEFVAPLVAARREAPISEGSAPTAAAVAASASAGDDQGDDEAVGEEVVAVSIGSRLPPGLRSPPPVVIRDDPEAGVLAPKASDWSAPGEGVPKLDALLKRHIVFDPIEYSQEAVLRWKQEVVAEFERLSRLSGSTPEEAAEADLVRNAASEMTMFEARDSTSGGPRLIQQLADVLNDNVFPINKFTRRKPDVRGSSLSMRGLIRFLLTNGSYKKIYQRPLAGPRREYKICVAFDRSASMMGGTASMTAYGVFAFLAALKKAGLDSQTIVLGFGDSVELVKPDGVPFDGRAAYRLLLACQPKRSFTEAGSLDADAISVGTALLGASSARGPSKMFLFTDGYTARPTRLPFTLQMAADAGVDVVALGLGTGTVGSALPSAFQHWVVVDQPTILPSALVGWCSANSGGGEAASASGGLAVDRLSQSSETSFMVEAASAMRSGEGELSMDSVFTGKGMTALTGLMDDLEGQTQLTVQSGPGSSESGGGSMAIDVVMCMDITGSMSSWVSAAREHMKAIVKSVQDKLSELGRNVSFRVGYVGFRDYEGSGSSHREVPDQIIVHSLTEDHEDLFRRVEAISCGYGGDCEDMIGGIQAALDMHSKQQTGQLPEVGWRERAAKFIIVIGDVPCHGRNWHDGEDSYPDGDPTGIDPRDQMEEMKKRQIRLMITVMEGGHMARQLETMCERFAVVYNENDFHGELVTLRTRDAHDGERFTKAVSGAIEHTIVADFL